MTNEIEKKFFEAFGIEPYDKYFKCSKQLEYECECEKPCECCELSEEVFCYPTISDRILLKLICLLVAKYWKTKEHYYLTALDEEYLRKEILNDACYVIDGMLSREKEVDFINQVRALFGESEEK